MSLILIAAMVGGLPAHHRLTELDAGRELRIRAGDYVSFRLPTHPSGNAPRRYLHQTIGAEPRHKHLYVLEGSWMSVVKFVEPGVAEFEIEVWTVEPGDLEFIKRRATPPIRIVVEPRTRQKAGG